MAHQDNPRMALIDAAEQLLRDRGMDEVTTREVAEVAGQRNSAAVHYHFGSRDGLFLEVFRARTRETDRMRREYLDRLTAEGRVEDVRALLEAVVLPLADRVRTGSGGPDYARFIARVAPMVDLVPVIEPAAGQVWMVAGGEPGSSHSEIAARLVAALPQLGSDEAAPRVALVLNLAVAAIAGLEARLAGSGEPSRAEFDRQVSRIIDVLVGALGAPDSLAG